MTPETPRWPTPLLRLVEAALNRVLFLDPGSAEALKPLEGRSVALRLKPWPTPLQLRVEDGRLHASEPNDPDLSIAATAGGLIALAAERGGFQLPAGRIDIAGDADLARRVQKLVEKLDPDWDAPLARVFGEVAGHQIGKGLRGLFAWGRETTKAMLANTSEYLREESRDLVAHGEMDQFIEDVDKVRDDVERIQARIERLAKRRAGTAKARTRE